jgi:hypothetical protein
MPQKKHKAEEIVAKLRQVDVLLSQGRTGWRSGSFDRRGAVHVFPRMSEEAMKARPDNELVHAVMGVQT